MNCRIRVVAGRASTLVVVLTPGLAGAFATPAGASDKSEAKKLVLTKADLGDGYASVPAAGLAPEVDPADLAKCVGKPARGRVTTAQVTGPNFDRPPDFADAVPTEVQIFSNVEIVKTKAMADADVAVFKHPKFEGCAAQNYSKSLGGQATRAGQPTTQVIPIKRYGNFSAALRVSLIANTEFGPIPVTFVFVFIRQGRAEITAFFVINSLGQGGLDQPATTTTVDIDQTEMYAIFDKLALRLKNAPK